MDTLPTALAKDKIHVNSQIPDTMNALCCVETLFSIWDKGFSSYYWRAAETFMLKDITVIHNTYCFINWYWACTGCWNMGQISFKIRPKCVLISPKYLTFLVIPEY